MVLTAVFGFIIQQTERKSEVPQSVALAPREVKGFSKSFFQKEVWQTWSGLIFNLLFQIIIAVF